MAVKAELQDMPRVPRSPACPRLQAKVHGVLRCDRDTVTINNMLASRLRKFRPGTTPQEAFLT
eukprot:9496127-Pyramimonas_sp.AAC.1